MPTPISVFGDVDQRALEQLERCAEAGDAVRAALCADHHVGYSQPIGGVIAYKDYVSPSGVGYDIACGNKAVRTKLTYDDIDGDVPRLMDAIFERISFGMGRKNNEPVDHPVFERIRNAPFTPQRQFLDLAVKQLGTVGSGNHYVDVFADNDSAIWVGVHFGSRGFGHRTATGFLALAQGKRFDEHASEGEMDSPPVLLDVNTELGQSYIEAMNLAGDYAYAGRDTVVEKVLEILGTEADLEIHNHHNFAWSEEVDGELCWVVRKGCTPAYPGQPGFVGATMGEASVVLEGAESEDSQALIYSTVHGAGRIMSRTRAAGKKRKRWACNNRDCNYVQGPGEQSPMTREGSRSLTGVCPKCGNTRLSKRWSLEVKGEIDWDAAQAQLFTDGIELRGAGADEAPGAYKRLQEVLAYHGDTINVLNTLHPLGVAMAGPDVRDDYKD